ncbi:MAG: DUF4956 domain-containing protein [Chitinophagaceae bacterium]|jgi:hypothetical protein
MSTTYLQIISNWTWEEVNPVFVAKLIVDLVGVYILTRFIYLKKHHRTDLFLTFFSFNIIVFFISYLLNRVDLSTGAAFGLFAIFSMLRYRTEGISAVDMTYLFLCIAIGLVMAVSTGSFFEHIVLAGFVLLMTYLLEKGFVAKRRSKMTVMFEKPELVHPDRKKELIDELEKRTGLKIFEVEVGDIDYLKDAVILQVHYEEA